MYLVDTSVWIDFLKNVSSPRVVFLEELLAGGDAALCEVVYTEICIGSKDKHQFEKYATYFGDLPFFKLPPAWHQEMARMGFSLKSKGHKPFVADLMIALTAVVNRVPLLTNDKDFEPYQELFGLVLA